MSISRREFVASTLAGLAVVRSVGLGAEGLAAPQAMAAEDGYKLWLRYPRLAAGIASGYAALARAVVVEGDTPTLGIVGRELAAATSAMLGTDVKVAKTGLVRGAIVAGTPAESVAIRGLGWDASLKTLGPEGFRIGVVTIGAERVIAVASVGEVGVLYGAFRLLRLMQTGQSLAAVNISERPHLQLRLLNHWDNPNGTIERGYAGRSLWQWADLPGTIDPRYADYARANASIGINGAVINNVNADAKMLTQEYLLKVAALAAVWRPYGVRVYLSPYFAAPKTIGGLATTDPLDAGVAAWWKAKAEEIYALIPDFGGFLVKANSEGQPGPKDYGRTHADGANMMARALAPHGGHVIWRAFIYDEDVDPDRAKRAYIEFMKLDGKFDANVLVQVKNGAIDFMPREPFHPLFGALKQTPVMGEIQPTQEYLGQAKHLVYLGTMWKEWLDSDTFSNGVGSTVGKTLDGTFRPNQVTGLAAVTNPGTDRNWCGHHFSQANWFAAGRLAWDHRLTAQQVAEEWTRMTFTHDPKTVTAIVGIMMASREAFVNYTMPLGLHHLIGGNHYAPMPQNGQAQRSDWTAVYYHQASTEAIGFDRTMKGDQAVGQYFPPVRDTFDNLATCPEKFLLWFHRLPWDYKLKSGATLWDGIGAKYQEGAAEAASFAATWQSLAGHIDPQRHKEVSERLAIQVEHAAAWRDQITAYFQTFSKRPIRPAPVTTKAKTT